MAAVQIKDVPDEVVEALTAEATRSGTSLEAYLVGLLEKEARSARNREIVAQTPLPGATLTVEEVVAVVREARGGERRGLGPCVGHGGRGLPRPPVSGVRRG